MRRFVILAVVLAAVFGFTRMEKASAPKKEFMGMVRTMIEKQHPQVRIKGEKRFGFDIIVNGSEVWLGLDNMYAAYQAQPRDLDNVVDAYVEAAKEGFDVRDMGWRLVRNHILPTLKPKDFAKTGVDLAKDRLVTYDFREGIIIAVAVDSKSSLRFVSQNDLKEWKVTKDQLMKTALQNLALLTEKRWKKSDEAAKKQGFYAFEVRDCYDASRLLLPDFSKHACQTLGCKKIATAAPVRDLLVAVAADDAEQVDSLKALVEETYKEGPYSISREIMYLPE